MHKIDLLKSAVLFQGLTDRELEKIRPLVKEMHFPKGHFLIHEGEEHKSLFIIEGEVEVLKKEPGSKKQHVLSKLQSGDVIGEMACLDDSFRSASARALVSTRVLSLPLSKLAHIDPAITSKIYENLAKELSARLRHASTITVEALKHKIEAMQARSAMGSYIVNLIILIFIYLYTIKTVSLLHITVISSSLISLPILSISAIAVFLMMKNSGYPLKMYGVTLKNWKNSLIESLLFTIPILALLVLVKWILISTEPVFQNLTLFHISYASNPGVKQTATAVEIALLVGGYCLFTPVQELIYRGALQSSLQKFLLSPNRKIWAIFISNLPFSLIHFHLSFTISIAAYLFGLFWGWMYCRHGTLVGVTISHLLIGAWAFFILGVQDVLRV